MPERADLPPVRAAVGGWREGADARYSVDAATFLAAVAGPAAAAVTERMAQANLKRAGGAD